MSQTSLSTIRQTLEAGLSSPSLELEDESHKHAGHAGVSHQLKGSHRGDGGITHLRVKVISPDFAGKSRIERHRIVNGLLEGEIARGLHAIAIEAKAPGE
ncbi:BolA family protein [Xanthobacter autotrophicus DSM 431]|uniref:BolA family protein n=1 Tax=Xanthobacter nonsaccharivorans TaxID=3119912 RepID=UPI00372B84A1